MNTLRTCAPLWLTIHTLSGLVDAAEPAGSETSAASPDTRTISATTDEPASPAEPPRPAEASTPSVPAQPPALPEPSRLAPRNALPALTKGPAPCPTGPQKGEPNQPPVWNMPPHKSEARAGEMYIFEAEARDPEGAPLTYRTTQLPPGARLESRLYSYHPCDDEERPAVQTTAPRIVWTPTRTQAGIHRFDIIASDGAQETSTSHEIEVRDDWETFFMPGASYSVYAPRGAGEGLYHGPSFELLLGAWIHRNENRGPSHGRVYLNVGLLDSTQGVDAVAAALGFDLSIERNPRRSFLIPFFGLEAGGLFRQAAVSVAQFTPALGLHFWTSQNVIVSASGGYLFPTARIDDLLGYTGRLSLDVSLW